MHQHNQRKASGSAIFWAWFLLITTCVIAIVPVVGFVSWMFGLATIAIVTILGVVIIGEGRTSSGVVILLAAYIALPVFILVAPVASSAIFMTNWDAIELPEIEISKDAVTDQRIKDIEPPAEAVGEY